MLTVVLILNIEMYIFVSDRRDVHFCFYGTCKIYYIRVYIYKNQISFNTKLQYGMGF